MGTDLMGLYTWSAMTGLGVVLLVQMISGRRFMLQYRCNKECLQETPVKEMVICCRTKNEDSKFGYVHIIDQRQNDEGKQKKDAAETSHEKSIYQRILKRKSIAKNENEIMLPSSKVLIIPQYYDPYHDMKTSRNINAFYTDPEAEDEFETNSDVYLEKAFRPKRDGERLERIMKKRDQRVTGVKKNQILRMMKRNGLVRMM